MVTLDCWGCGKPFTYLFIGGKYRQLCDSCRVAREAAHSAEGAQRSREYRARKRYEPSGKPPSYNVARFMVESGQRSPSDLDDEALRWLFRDLIEKRKRDLEA